MTQIGLRALLELYTKLPLIIIDVLNTALYMSTTG
jgi:hypothetical protein